MTERTKSLIVTTRSAWAALCLAFIISGAFAQPTSPTLTLDSIFSIAPTPAPVEPPPDLLFTLPDTAHWRLPKPTATPTPTPEPTIPPDAGLRKIERFPQQLDPRFQQMNQPGLRFKGVSMRSEAPDHALIELNTTYLYLRSEYRLLRVDREEPPLIVRHAPQTAEQFALPPGRYRLERRVWLAEDPKKFREEKFPEQNLTRGGTYEFIARAEDEQDLLTRLRR